MSQSPELAKTVVPTATQPATADELGATVVPAPAARTLAPDALGATVVPGAGGGPAAGRQATTEGRRTTVLPTVVMNGEKPQVSMARRDRFEEVAKLGQGGMGEVLLLQDHDIDRAVALKRLPEQADLGSVLRFVDEIRTVGSLEHPNIVPVHDVGVDERGRYFFVMKHLKGDTLEGIIERLKAGDQATHARFTFSVRQQVFLGVLNAVNYAHRQGIIHRDLKPANIMVGPYGEVTVMDWGLAKRLRGARPELPAAPAPAAAAATPEKVEGRPSSPSGRDQGAYATQVGDVMGTPMYMSPEQARGENDKVDERTDTYALTVIYHELMYLDHYLEQFQTIPEILDGVQHRKPFAYSLKHHPTQTIPPAECVWFVDQGLEKDPAKRYQSVQEMIDTLQRGLGARVKVQCQRTMVKRGLQELQRAADAHPMVVMIALFASSGLLLAALVKAAISLF